MKKAIIIFLLLMVTTARSQWQSMGNAERINTKHNIVDFVVSQDSKYIFTLDDSNRISKYDYITGNYISTKQIVPPNGLTSSIRWIFLSSDGITYCTIYPHISDNRSQFINKIFIYNIDTYILEDSITNTYSAHVPMFVINYNFKNAFIDYNYKSKTLLTSFSNIVNITGPWLEQYNEGNLTIQIKTDTGWKTNRIFFNYNNVIKVNWESNFIFNNNNNYFSHLQTQPFYNSYLRNYISNLIYSIKNDTSFVISNYSYNETQGNVSTSGEDHYFQDCIYYPDNQNFLLFEHNKAYKFNILLDTFTNVQIIENYPANLILPVYNSIDTNFFFIVQNDSLNIYNINSLNYYITFLVDSISHIGLLKNSNDSWYVFLSDSRGSLFRIRNDYLFALRANFLTDDTIFAVGDSVKFSERSLGYPDSYFWDFGDGSTSTEANPIHFYLDTGYYNIKLVVTKGNLKDSLVKNNYIYVAPKLKADFDYSITSFNPITVSFTNKSIGIIDSVKWYFGDDSISNATNPLHVYKIICDYKATLQIFTKTLSNSITKTIKILGDNDTLDKNKFAYEFTDTTMYNGIALKGYEDTDNYLIYHIRQSTFDQYFGTMDTIYFHGAYKNFVKLWEKENKEINQIDYLFKRENGTYSYLLKDSITSLDKNGLAFNTKKTLNVSNLLSINCIKNNINLLYRNSDLYFYLMELNDKNETIYNNTIRQDKETHSYGNWGMYDTYFKMKSIKDKTIDYSFTRTYHFYSPLNNQNLAYSFFEVNGTVFINWEWDDFIRLNDSSLFYISNNQVELIRNYGKRLDSVIVPSTCKKIFERVINQMSFKNIMKLNDSTFIVVGSHSQNPAYMIFNEKGEVKDSVVLSDRIGEFEYVSVTPDTNLLFSGYRYKFYSYKSPYFVKSNDSLIWKSLGGHIAQKDTSSKDSSNIDTTHHDSTQVPLNFTQKCSPNPVTGIANITFTLQKGSFVRLRIFDCYGELVYSIESKEYPKGDNSIEVNFSNYSTGYFYYWLEVDGVNNFGTIVFLR